LLEESCGIIDTATILAEGGLLLDVQAHNSIGDTELVEVGDCWRCTLCQVENNPYLLLIDENS